MTGALDLNRSGEAVSHAQRWLIARLRMAAKAWPAWRALASAGVLAAGRRLRVAAPRLLLLGAGLSICVGGALFFLSEAREPDLAPGIDAGQLEESTMMVGEWLPIQRPIALYALESPDLVVVQRDYSARRHSLSGAREDVLTINAFEDGNMFLVVRFHRAGAAPESPSSLFVETVRGAAGDGFFVERMASPVDMPTKFGLAETADAALANADAKRNCIAFRATIVDRVLRLSGVACGAAARPIDRAQLSCLIDRTALLASGDVMIKTAFARAELQRKPACDGSRGRRAGWLDPAGQPSPLRSGLIAQR